MVAICTGFSIPISIGPMTALPPSSRSSFADRLPDCSPRHHQNIRGARKATEGIIGHDARIQRDVGRHFAFIFEGRLAIVEDVDGIADIVEPRSRRVAEGRIGQEGNARFVTHAARDLRRAVGDVGEHFGRGAFVDRRVGHEDGVMLSDENVNAERRLALGRVDHPPHFAHRLRIGARHAGDHRIAKAEFEQQRAEDVAIAVDHTFDVAAQIGRGAGAARRAFRPSGGRAAN